MNDGDFDQDDPQSRSMYIINMTTAEKAIVGKIFFDKKNRTGLLMNEPRSINDLFPYDTLHKWSVDNYGGKEYGYQRKEHTLTLTPTIILFMKERSEFMSTMIFI